MSAKRHPPSGQPHRQHDPHGIVPDGFLDAYNAETIPEALDKAERAPSTTNPHTQPRCPDCGSIKCIPKPGHREIPDKLDTNFSCGECGSHFDERKPSRLEELKQRAAESRENSKREIGQSQQSTFDEVIEE